MQRQADSLYQRKNCGLTLIELLIAMLLSSVILFTAYSLLNYQQHYFAQHQQQVHLEQNKRFAQFVLSNALHQAGYFGCRSLAHSKVTNHSKFDPTKLVAIFAYQAIGNSWLPTLPKEIKAKKGTDVLAIIYEAPHTALLTIPMLNPTDNITLHETSIFKTGDIAVMNDCDQADIFTISQINGFKKQLHHTSALSKAYAQPTEVGQLLYYLFYIQPKNPNDKDSADDLYVLDQSNIPEELVDHVDDLQLQFATHDSPHNYVTANAIHNWLKVHSVEVELVLSSKNQATQNYSFITSLRNQ